MQLSNPNPSHPALASVRRPAIQLLRQTSFDIRHIRADIDHLNPALEGLSILHLSDMHLRRRWQSAHERLLESCRQLAPDLILITGDIIENRRDHTPAWPNVQRLLGALRSRLGSFAILGNHDNILLGAHLPSLGVELLQGQRRLVRCGEAQLELIGAPGPQREHLPIDFAQRFGRGVSGTPRIVLSHFPDHWRHLHRLKPDLYLCGHTHGGQICLPTGHPILRHDTMPRRFARGRHRVDSTHFIVNHGFGFSGPQLRLFCPAEVILITLNRRA